MTVNPLLIVYYIHLLDQELFIQLIDLDLKAIKKYEFHVLIFKLEKYMAPFVLGTFFFRVSFGYELL